LFKPSNSKSSKVETVGLKEAAGGLGVFADKERHIISSSSAIFELRIQIMSSRECNTS
jgi:hypothetical protein